VIVFKVFLERKKELKIDFLGPKSEPRFSSHQR
jgi:hypothetical protein